jgi:hypothetical protein
MLAVNVLAAVALLVARNTPTIIIVLFPAASTNVPTSVQPVGAAAHDVNTSSPAVV